MIIYQILTVETGFKVLALAGMRVVTLLREYKTRSQAQDAITLLQDFDYNHSHESITK